MLIGMVYDYLLVMMSVKKGQTILICHWQIFHMFFSVHGEIMVSGSVMDKCKKTWQDY